MQYFLSVLLYHSTNYKLEQQFCTIATIARVSRKIEKNIFQFFFLAIDFNKKNAKYSLLTFHYPDKWDIYILPKLYIACLIYIYWKTFSTDVSIEYRSSLDIWLPYILFLKFHRFFSQANMTKKSTIYGMCTSFMLYLLTKQINRKLCQELLILTFSILFHKQISGISRKVFAISGDVFLQYLLRQRSTFCPKKRKEKKCAQKAKRYKFEQFQISFEILLRIV